MSSPLALALCLTAGRARPLSGALALLLPAALILAAEAWSRSSPDWRRQEPTDPVWTTFLPPRPERASNNDRRSRIVCVGGSTTAGYPFPGAGYPEWMSRELARCGAGDSHEVLLRAAGGLGSIREKGLLEAALAVRPAAVILHSGHNESPELAVYGGIPSVLKGASAAVLWNSALFRRLVRSFPGRAVPRPGLSGPWGLPSFRRPPSPGEILARFEGNLREMVRSVRSAGAVPVVCGTPVNLKFPPTEDTDRRLFQAADNDPALARDWIDRYHRARDSWMAGRCGDALSVIRSLQEKARARGVRWIEGMCSVAADPKAGTADLIAGRDGALLDPALLRDIQLRVSREEGAVFVDLAAALSAKTRDGLPDPRFFVDSHHLSAEGYRVMGRAALSALSSRGIVPPGCPRPWDGASAGMLEKELGLGPEYEAIPRGLLANEYLFYAHTTGHPWFQRKGLASLAAALKADRTSALSRVSTGHPAIARGLAIAFRELGDDAEARRWEAGR